LIEVEILKIIDYHGERISYRVGDCLSSFLIYNLKNLDTD